MKRLFTFFAACFVTMLALAATDYGISVGEVSITSDNCNSVTGSYIKSGTVTYNFSTNTLTLKNTIIDCEDKGASVALYVKPTAKNELRIVLEGVNTFRNTNGATVVIYKNSSYINVYSTPNVYIQGTGTLTLEQKGGYGGHIMCMDGVNVCFGDFTMGGAGQGGCTINARCIYSRDNAGGYLWISDATINLTGFSYYSGGVLKGGTIYGFKTVAFRSGYCYYSEVSEGCKYDETNLYLTDANGNRVTGAAYIGWKDFGLEVGGTKVMGWNYKNVTNSRITGTVSYSPSTRTLSLNEAKIEHRFSETPTIINTGQGLIVDCTGDCAIEAWKGEAAITSSQNLTFSGSGSLAVNSHFCDYAIKMTGGSNTLRFNLNNATITGKNNLSGGQLYLKDCNMTAENFYHVGGCTLSGTGIQTEEVFYSPTDSCFVTSFWKKGYPSDITFAKVNESYGIYIGGHELNDVNANNFYYYNLTGGVNYDAPTRTLTFDDMTADCQNLYNGINAGTGIKLKLLGTNTLKNISGVGILFNGHSTIQGNGSLTVEGDIEGNNGSSVIFMDGCSVSATQLLGRNGNGGALRTNGCTLTLSGNNSSATVSGFTSVSGTTPVAYPALAAYNKDRKVLMQNNRTVTGRVEVRNINVGDITNLINDYLEGRGNITVANITDLISVYLGANPTVDDRAVDLGLSVLWASMNVGAYTPEECGDYFAWGETQPKDTYNWATYKWCEGSNRSLTKYNNDSSFGNIYDKTELDLADDAAYTNWGGPWRTPTYEEMEELISECTWTWTTQNDMAGYNVVGPNGNSIFLPAAGHYSYSSSSSVGYTGNYRTSSINPESPANARSLKFESTYFNINYYYRYFGQSVRPVCQPAASLFVPLRSITLSNLTMNVGDTRRPDIAFAPANASNSDVVWSSSNSRVAYVDNDGLVRAKALGSAVITCTATDGSGVRATCEVTVDNLNNGHEYVDLGLSVKWATMNIGATSPEDDGDYFTWGETTTKSAYDWSTYKYCNGSSTTLTKYCTDSSYGTVDNKTVLELSDDAGRTNWGGTWRMPTDAELTELRTKCTWTWTTQNGKNGYKVVGPNGNSVFLPAAGYRYDTSLRYAGSDGYYWSSSLNESTPSYAWYVYFSSSGADRYYYGSRCYGRSVRAVCP